MKTDNKKIQYFLYARKSTESEDKQVASIEAQISELKKIAQQDNLSIVKTFSESRSAKAPGRPIFNEMVGRVQSGEANGILCWKLNRLARNPIDGAAIQWMLQQGVIQHVQTYGRSYYPTDNVIMMAVELGMANQFIRDLSTDTKRGLNAKAEKGWLPGRAPLGYTNNKFKEKGRKDILKNPVIFPIVRKMWDLLLENKYSVQKIYNIAVDEWGLRFPSGKKPAQSKIYQLFANPFYYGYFRYAGAIHKGNHEPMVSEEEFNEAQYILGTKNRPKSNEHLFAFTGLMRCGECGSGITAEERTKHQKNGNVHDYIYYHCTKKKNTKCTQKYIEEKELKKQISEVTTGVEIPKEFHEWAMEVFRSMNTKEAESRNAILQNQQKEYEACVRKIDSLIDMRAAGEINEEEFGAKKTQALAEKSRMQELLKDTDTRVNNWLDYAEEALDLAEMAAERLKSKNLETQRGVLADIGSNLILKDRILSLDIEKPLLAIKQAAETAKEINKRLEPLESLYNSTSFEEIYARFPVMGA